MRNVKSGKVLIDGVVMVELIIPPFPSWPDSDEMLIKVTDLREGEKPYMGWDILARIGGLSSCGIPEQYKDAGTSCYVRYLFRGHTDNPWREAMLGMQFLAVEYVEGIEVWKWLDASPYLKVKETYEDTEEALWDYLSDANFELMVFQEALENNMEMAVNNWSFEFAA